MKVRIVDTLRGLEELENSWNRLASRCASPSLYSSYDYNRIAWKHFSSLKDSLFVLTLYEGSELKAVAPLCISIQKIHHVPTRTIRFIADWEGDKPSITAAGCEEAAWDAIFIFLLKEFRHWEVLDLREQPRNSTFLSQCAFLNDRGFICEIAHDSTSYYVALAGSWESYLAAVDPKVKENWRNRGKKLRALPKGLSVETISQPEHMAEALRRFAALEKMSWKGGAGISIYRDAALRRFYEEITFFLAKKAQTRIFFLKTGDEDIAGSLRYLYRDVVYSRHIAYNPRYAKLSPGTYLRTYELQHFFGKGLREYDMMGMPPDAGIPQHKIDWATGTRETIRIYLFNNNLKMLPIKWGKKIKSQLRDMVSACE